jgi:hypothetical protein
MRPKLATLMRHLKVVNARLDRRLQAIEKELLPRRQNLQSWRGLEGRGYLIPAA